MRIVMLALLCACLLMNVKAMSEETSSSTKTQSVFFPAAVRAKAQANIAKYPWAAQARSKLLEDAESYLKLSDDELWQLVFGPTIRRSWMVWSDGYCPSCKKSVPMYTWKASVFETPWKMRCPHCSEFFPKNDFGAFYRSGLDEHGVFDPKRADRALLYNTEHPDPKDPLHLFGVDDGTGYRADNHCWMFIGTYLIYGQWKQGIVAGARSLAHAYVVTGDQRYAHKALILLDRVADLYPGFSAYEQLELYEGKNHAHGYVSVWHDACDETRQLALAYDEVFDALRADSQLVTFLSQKAKRFGLSNAKTSPEAIQQNIEDGILRDALRSRPKIQSNFPHTDVANATMMAILGWPQNRSEVLGLVYDTITTATAADGVTGEKGLAAYARFGIHGLAQLLSLFDRMDPSFLAEAVNRCPNLKKTYRFHADTRCLNKYYPLSGDGGSYAQPVDGFVTPTFEPLAGVTPSMYTLYANLAKVTQDPVYLQILYSVNKRKVDGLPYDLFADNVEQVQKNVSEVIAKLGENPKVKSMNLTQWHLGLLRAGEGAAERALWLDYDSGGPHGHSDLMNLGLFARGLDLMPEMGYPPVQYGGWGSPKALWYVRGVAHNTVTIDDKDSGEGEGRTTLWADGAGFHAMRASAPGEVSMSSQQYERTVAMIDLDQNDFYVLDVFRVIGGHKHTKYQQSHFGTLTPALGLNLKPAAEFTPNTQMRAWQVDSSPRTGWSVEWTAEDRYKTLPKDQEVKLRYTDLTSDTQVATAEGWLSIGGYNDTQEVWVPRLAVRREAGNSTEPLASTFVSVMEPHGGAPHVLYAGRVELLDEKRVALPEANVGVECLQADGRRDLVIALDVENPRKLTPSWSDGKVIQQRSWGVSLDGELALVRRGTDGKLSRLVLCHGKQLLTPEGKLTADKSVEFVEVGFKDGKPIVERCIPEQAQVKLEF